jgi:hypothetical protein
MACQLREYAEQTIGKNRRFKQSPVLVTLKKNLQFPPGSGRSVKVAAQSQSPLTVHGEHRGKTTSSILQAFLWSGSLLCSKIQLRTKIFLSYGQTFSWT